MPTGYNEALKHVQDYALIAVEVDEHGSSACHLPILCSHPNPRRHSGEHGLGQLSGWRINGLWLSFVDAEA